MKTPRFRLLALLCVLALGIEARSDLCAKAVEYLDCSSHCTSREKCVNCCSGGDWSEADRTLCRKACNTTFPL